VTRALVKSVPRPEGVGEEESPSSSPPAKAARS